MRYHSQRPGLRLPRGLIVLLLILAAVIGAAFWIGPFQPIPAELRLLVGDADPASPARLANAGTAADPRFPLVLALENQGGRTARPVSVSLSVPAVFRLRSSVVQLERESSAGNALARYRVPLAERSIQPGSPAELLAPGDTLWLEPLLADYYCTALSDSIPEFLPAPALPAAALADVRVFYSFAEAADQGRIGGLLELRLDPTSLSHQPAPMPPTFPTQVREPEIPRPDLGQLHAAGSRTAECGDPQQPLELYTVTWETATGGRFLVVYHNGAPRKQLFDLDRDSIIELEMWDPDADGRFEARRAARYAIPPFLLPERLPEEPPPAGVAVGTAEWEALFADTARGPFRFTPDSLLPAALRPVGVVVDSAWVRRFDDVAAGPFRFTPDSLRPPSLRTQVAVDSAWLRKFNDVAAGPFRFSNDPPPLRAKPPTPPPARPRGPVPLGTPVPYPRPPGGGN